MLVSEVMTRDVKVADPEMSIGAAAKVMEKIDAGFLPLPSPQGHDAFLVDIDRFGPAIRGFLDAL